MLRRVLLGSGQFAADSELITEVKLQFAVMRTTDRGRSDPTFSTAVVRYFFNGIASAAISAWANEAAVAHA